MNAPPLSDPAAETAILRLITSRLWSAMTLIGKAAALLRPEDFASTIHSAVFRAALELHAEGKPVDLLTIQDRIGERQLRTFGAGDLQSGMAALTNLLTLGDDHLAPSLLESASAKVAGLSRRRRLLRLLSDVAETANGTECDDALNALERGLAGLRQGRETFETLADVAERMPAYFEELLKGRETVPAGFSQLDAILRLEPGHLCVVGAYTSIGKTAFACAVVANLIRRQIPCGILSLEMEPEQIGKRLVSLLGKIPVNDWQPGAYITEDMNRRLQEAIAELAREDCFLDAPLDFRLAQIRAKASAMARKGARLLVIDYLQLIKADAPPNTKREEILEISRGLKLVARENRVVVLTLAQLRREAESASRPQLGHLQESSSIEQDADAVILLHRPQKDDYLQRPTEEAAVIVAKSRHGQRGVCALGFDRRLGAFVDVEASPQNPA